MTTSVQQGANNEPDLTLRKVKDVVQQLKDNKSADKDGIGVELIKMGPEKMAICLQRLITVSAGDQKATGGVDLVVYHLK